MAKRKNQSDHDDMVLITANYLVSNLYTDVKADIADYETPEQICWKDSNECHIPDISGKLNGIQHIWEIETEDTISVEHTKKQWKLFSEYASQFEKVFHIVVPEDCSIAAEKQASEWGINAEFHEVKYSRK